MDLQLSTESLALAPTDAVAIGVFTPASDDPAFKYLDRELDGYLSSVAENEDFAGKNGVLHVRVHGEIAAKHVIVVGLGEKKDYGAGQIRDYANSVLAKANAVKAKSVTVDLPSVRGADAERVKFATIGFNLGSYSFDKYIKKPKKQSVKQVALTPDVRGRKPTAAKKRAYTKAIADGQAIADAVANARDLVNEPAEAIYPKSLASHAQALGKKSGISVKVLSEAECRKMGMNMFLAVGQGSERRPVLIHMTYKPKKKAKKKVALIGKGVTFDSGGYSLKPSNFMMDMKCDMGGSAAVISAMSALQALDCPYEVHAVVAAVENLVSGGAYKLGDVLKSMEGTTVEINNTDAEGRLTLGDALYYARTKIKPDEMFDFATLTGACMVALGPDTAGVMSDHEQLAKKWLASAESAGEKMWRLPLDKGLKKQLRSPIADMRNTGERYGGAITAGLFLQTFVGETPWVHVDIAGPAHVKSPSGHIKKGGTGFAVATILEYLS